jgi:uroporphyrinogen-III synthase
MSRRPAAAPGPLAGRGIAVTRTEPVDGALARRLAARGARVVRWPSVVIVPPLDRRPLRAAAAAVDGYDWVVFTSAHAVAAFAATGTRPERARVAAVGPGTAAEITGLGWRCDLIGPGPGADALVGALAAAEVGPATRVLFPAASDARPALEQGLARLGARVERVEAYRLRPAPVDPEDCRQAIAAGRVDAITFASPSAAAALAASFGLHLFRALTARLAVVSIGPTTTEELTRLGRKPDAEASPSTFDGLVDATERALGARGASALSTADSAPEASGGNR